MTTPLSILTVAAIYGAVSFATTQAVFAADGAAVPAAGEPSPGRLQRELVRMVVVLICAGAGAMLQSREAETLTTAVAARNVITGAFVFPGLAAAVVAGMRPVAGSSATTFYIGLASIVVVVFVAMLANQWPALVAGVFCAAPFGLSAIFYARPSSTDDTMYAGLTGAVLTIVPAIFILFVACLTSLAIARLRNRPSSTIRFFPYVAGFAIVGLTIQFALIP